VPAAGVGLDYVGQRHEKRGCTFRRIEKAHTRRVAA
jgi:hypothetical protein